MSQLGIGVMIKALCSNEETVNSIKSSLNKEIANIVLSDDNLVFTFTDGSKLNLWDGGQSCCEHRYMKCDDDLGDYVGSKLLDFELKDAKETEEEYEVHEIQFLDVKTSAGVFQIANHNEHNGYYGGFYIQASTG